MMEGQDHQVQERNHVRTIKWIALLTVVVIAIVFVFKNDQKVDLDYIFGTVDIPLIWGLLAALLMGFIAGWLTGSFRRGRD